MSSKTVAIVIGCVVTAVLVFGFLYFRFSATTNLLKIQPKDSASGEATQIRLDQLEQAVAALIKKVDIQQSTTSAKPVTSSTSTQGLDARLNNIESTLAVLQVSVNQLKQSGVQSTGADSSSVSRSPLYIPLGWSGSSSATNWTSITTQTFEFNPSDYSGFKSLTFEVNLQVYQGNGKAYARLYNSTDGVAVYGTDVSSTSQDYLWVSSSNFSVPTSKKTYVLQLKTNTGYASMVQNARIKVNF